MGRLKPYRRPLSIALVAGLLALAPAALAQDGGSGADVESVESTTSGGDSEAGESAWNEFHGAFRALARGEAERSARLLVRLREKHRDRAAGAFARPVLGALRERSDVPKGAIPAESEWRDLSEHPAVQDRGSDIYDPAWAKYREAFVELARDDVETARSRLGELTVEYGDHAAAELASEILATLDESTSDDRADEDSAQSESRSAESAEPEPAESTGDEYLVEGSDDSPESFRSPSSGGGRTGLRIAAESGGGMAGAVIGASAGWGVGFVIGDFTNATGPYGGSAASTFAIVGAGIGGLALFPLGTYLVGDLAGGEGSLPWTYVGGGAGLAAGGLLSVVVPGGGADVLTVSLISVAGAIVGYESTRGDDRAPRDSPKGAVVRPFAAPPTGESPAVFGLHGRF